jgi:hypothetical protein
MIYDLLKNTSIPATFTLAGVIFAWKAAFIYKDHEDAAISRANETAVMKASIVTNSEDIEELESSIRSTKKLIEHFHPPKISAAD